MANNIQPDELINLHNIGFKPIALNDNNREVEPWTPIYDNPDYWTPERLKQEAHKFKNVATVFGKTYLRDEQGRELYLNVLDIDSDIVYDILFNLENGNTGNRYSLLPKLQRITFVTKTRKKNGFHVSWLSHKQNKPIRSEDCRLGYEFEIKTDKSGGHCTLPPSRHRDDPNFCYKNYGQNKIVVSDKLYNKLVSLLAPDCLKDRNKNQSKDNKFGSKDGAEISLSEESIKNISDLIHPYYKKGFRNGIIYAITGLLHKYNITKESATKLVEILAKDDEEKRGRMTVLEQTYKKLPIEVTGIIKFMEVLEHATGNVTL